MQIQTVKGPVAKQDFGFCHSHEHLFLAPGQPSSLNPALCIDDYQRSVEELLLFQSCGGRAIVDAQPLGCGRIESWLLEASLATDIHIVASTGFHKLSFYHDDHWIRKYEQDRLTDLFVHELTAGMFLRTDAAEPDNHMSAKAGVIKTAMDEDRMNDPDKRWFRAAASAAIRTGAPILCHIESYAQAETLVHMYLELGVPAGQIIICHLDRKLDQLASHRKLGEMGVYLEYDTIARYKYHSDEEEALLIRQMMEWGLEKQVLLGLDTTRERLKSYGGKIGLDFIRAHFMPLLKQTGIRDEHIRLMMIDNPANAFAIRSSSSQTIRLN
ncbi:phosphotriesterase [Paenibacillus sp. GCM10027628]|uniref:phosphotriesterase family protein n=1 Tax=Paenibacillus sp. GCM10027628 TaxID=3273413 RepID=UPI003629D0D9